MSIDIVLSAKAREDAGKGASRRLRRQQLVPAIIYGGKEQPQAVSLKVNEVLRALTFESFFSQVSTLDIDGKKTQVIIKDLQRHPYKNVILHMDFQRVSRNTELHVHVPLHYLNEESCAGVKTGGGTLNKHLVEIHVSALPANLPEYLEVDVAELEVGASLHISDLKLPEGVSSLDLSHGDDKALVTVQRPAGGGADDADEGGAE